jgi:multisubunit Na+/H+ antiporter MnhB subunit
MVLLGGYGASVVSASDSVLGDACKQNSTSVICSQSKDAEKKTEKFVTDLIDLLLYAIGIISVIMIIIGGIRYTTSNGDSSQITGAKNTILYAVVGLIVAILAYAIVGFIVGKF